MADFFDKLKQELDKGITTISVKAKETIETTKIKGQISKGRQKKVIRRNGEYSLFNDT